MTVAMSEIALPSFCAGLRVLESLLIKGEAHASDRSIVPAALLESRLAADMFSFTEQVQAASDTARRGVQRMAGQEVPGMPDPEPTFAALKQRVAETLAGIEATDRELFDASTERAFVVEFGPEMKVQYVGRTYLLSFVLPNFYFHVTTAYNILRERGVSVGKMDFLGPLGAAYKVG